MTARRAIQAARAVGVRLRVEGDGLVLESEAAPPRTVLDDLARFKVEIVAMLRPAADGWSVEDWHAFFDERAAIGEHDGGLSPPEAEARAFACCVAEWMNRNFAGSRPGRCASCGRTGDGDDPLAPVGIEPAGHAWLHDGCRAAWQSACEHRAITTLQGMGIGKNSELPNDFGKIGGA